MDRWTDTEQIVDRLRSWIDETQLDAQQLADELSDEGQLGGGDEAVGEYALVERLTALKHEVKLLTKATRGAEERQEATLLAMQAAIEQFRSVQPEATGTAANKSLVESLADLDEALARGRGAVEQARVRLLEVRHTELKASRDRLDALYQVQSWWRRWLCRPWHEAVRELHQPRALGPDRDLLDALVEGFELIQGRLRRTMEANDLLRMMPEGRQFDPHSMTVVETIADPGRPQGMVVAEVRPGYYWKSDVLRFAEVKVVGKELPSA